MFSPLRIAYKLNRKTGRYLSMKLDKFDDKISNKNTLDLLDILLNW